MDRDPPPPACCARCGAEFTCGARAGAAACWCAELPPLAPVPGQTCLCRSCLEARLREELRNAPRYNT